MQKNQIGLFSHTIYKNKLKLNLKLKIGYETIKLLEEAIDSMIFNVILNNIFFLSVSSGKGNRSKKQTNKQMGLHQSKNLL